MYTHNINPVIVQLGPLGIRYYGLVYVIGFLFLLFFLKYHAKKGYIKNLDSESTEVFVLYLIAGAIIGARLFEVLVYNPVFYLSNPGRIIMIWAGGLSFHGGLVGAVAASLIFCKRKKVDFYELGDIVVMPLAFFLGLGRIANFINAENIGTMTNARWCVNFPTAEGCKHPVQLYEAIKNFFISGVLLTMHRFRKSLHLPKGALFWYFWLFYGMLRFAITFMREDPRMLGISLGQLLCLIMITAGIVGLVSVHKRKKDLNT